MEIDISKKVNNLIKYGFAALLGTALLVSGSVWFYQKSHHCAKVYDAQIKGALVNVNAKTTGTIKELLAKNGAHVKVNEKLAVIKVEITEEHIKQLEQAVDTAAKNLAKLREGTTVTRLVQSDNSYRSNQAAANLEKMERLYELGAISANKVEEARAAYYASQGSGDTVLETVHVEASPQVIQNAEIQLKQAKASLERAKSESASTTVVSPVEGILYYKDLKQDTKVRPGQIIFSVSGNDMLWVEARLKPGIAEKAQIGQTVSYEVGNHKLNGTILEIIPPADKSAPSQTAKEPPSPKNENQATLKISLTPPPDVILAPGDKATVEIPLNE